MPPPPARWLGCQGHSFDLALCSTAVRTRETWKLAVQELPHRPRTVYEERLYEASLGDLIALLNETPDEVHDLSSSATTPACTPSPTRWPGAPRVTRWPG